MRYQSNNLLGIGLMMLAMLLFELWTGAAIIIACGLYVIHRESLRHRAHSTVEK